MGKPQFKLLLKIFIRRSSIIDISVLHELSDLRRGFCPFEAIKMDKVFELSTRETIR